MTREFRFPISICLASVAWPMSCNTDGSTGTCDPASASGVCSIDTPACVVIKGTTQASLDRACTFSGAFEDATIAVDVTAIAPLLRHGAFAANMDDFRATVNATFKGGCEKAADPVQNGDGVDGVWHRHPWISGDFGTRRGMRE